MCFTSFGTFGNIYLASISHYKIGPLLAIVVLSSLEFFGPPIPFLMDAVGVEAKL